MKKAVFIDKDGTLIKNLPWNVNTQLIQFEENAIASLQLLQESGYQLVLISNQPGIALGYFTEEAVIQVFKYLEHALTGHGVQLNAYYYCPHDARGIQAPYIKTCYCRKPLPGLLLKAAMELDIDLERSWMIGDILHDTEAGNRAGCKTILLNNGNETEWELTPCRQPSYICKNWKDAAGIINRQ
ncbi:D-glycero-alpha-D-manno-heptose-1,7-bisphosphate 7-phosphatase [Niastella populi]|uniref:D,D-heptose 1,7-bisphosphate phosphatase n=1 Tax=Niastella populi TaxID=550983 RepID=A0A1V9EUW7_9BACT|nr:HAD-IIIA family hydrolase [Niastella populi]OQP49940.1 HAD family hydrolase [Niastella populi]